MFAAMGLGTTTVSSKTRSLWEKTYHVVCGGASAVLGLGTQMQLINHRRRTRTQYLYSKITHKYGHEAQAGQKEVDEMQEVIRRITHMYI